MVNVSLVIDGPIPQGAIDVVDVTEVTTHDDPYRRFIVAVEIYGPEQDTKIEDPVASRSDQVMEGTTMEYRWRSGNRLYTTIVDLGDVDDPRVDHRTEWAWAPEPAEVEGYGPS